MARASTASGAWSALSADLADSVDRVGRSVVAIRARERIPSSGIHWRTGIVAAANHTIRRDDDITVMLPDGTTVPATIAGRDPTTDLAALRLAPAGGAGLSAAPVATLGDAGTLRVGHLALAIGRPGREPAAGLGMVGTLGGAWHTAQGGSIDRFIGLDLSIFDGFSGGALVHPSGEIVGLLTSGLARGSPIAVPASTVTRVVDQLAASGRIARGYLGVGVQPVRLPEALATKLGLADRGGAIVIGVEPGSPAERGGLLMGDVLVAIGGTPITRASDLMVILGAERVGKPVVARVIRAGEARDVTLTVGERPRRAA
jgi:S1-C subfamily serine protease